MSLSTHTLDEIPPEQEWREKWNTVKKLADELWKEAEELMRKWRIPYEDPWDPDLYADWAENLLISIFEKRIWKDREEMRKTVAFHPFIWSTIHYTDGLEFDLKPNNAIQSCARILLLELREANKEKSKEPVVL